MNIHLPEILGFTRGTRVLTHCHIGQLSSDMCYALDSATAAERFFEVTINPRSSLRSRCRWPGVNVMSCEHDVNALSLWCGFLLENDVKSCNIGEVRWKIGVNYDGIPNFQTFDIFSKKGENWGFNSGIQPESGCDIPHEYCFLGCILWILCSWLVGWASQC